MADEGVWGPGHYFMGFHGEGGGGFTRDDLSSRYPTLLPSDVDGMIDDWGRNGWIGARGAGSYEVLPKGHEYHSEHAGGLWWLM